MAVAIEQFHVQHEMFALVRIWDEQRLSSAVVLQTKWRAIILTATRSQLDVCMSVRYVFNSVINNSQQVLQPMLPAKRDSQYNLTTMMHNRLLIDKSADLNDCDFIIRMLYKSSY